MWLDDGHYLYFGWWQVTPDQADGVYDFHVFADGVGRWRDGFINRENSNGVSNYMQREASNVVYTGPAVGKYVRTLGAHDELDHADERRRQAVAGIFTANARLEADFSEGLSSAANGGTVEGLISNFVDEATGDAIPGRWQIVLGAGEDPSDIDPATINYTSSGSDITDALAVIKQIGQGGGQGALPTETQTGQKTWQAYFMADELAGPNTRAGVRSLPAAVVGRFDVGLQAVIHFSGAFGATQR